MGFVKLVKNKAYYKRFQVRFRRRRECKTDYKARQKLIWVDKNKYAAPKYRFVVRFTNRDVITAIIASDLQGDRTLVSAYGHELRKYGLKFGFNNYAATYATGLLCARRLNAKLGLNTPMNENITEEFDPAHIAEEQGTRRPFKAFLDVGLHRTTTGSRLFAAVKGACDGGVSVPHQTTRFVGSAKEEDGEIVTDFEVVRKYIFGGHVADYMNYLQENDEEDYKRQFSAAVKHGVSADQLEEIYSKVHEGIRAETDESLVTGKARDANTLGYFKTRSAPRKGTVEEFKANSKSNRYFDTKKNAFVAVPRPIGIAARKQNLLNKLNAWVAKIQAEAEAAAGADSDDNSADEESEESGSDEE